MTIEERKAELNERARRAEESIGAQLDRLADLIRGEIEFAIPNTENKIRVCRKETRGFDIGVRGEDGGFTFGTVSELYLWDQLTVDAENNRITKKFEFRLQKGSVGGVSPDDRDHLLADRVKGFLAGWMLDDAPFLKEIKNVLETAHVTTDAIDREHRIIREEENAERNRQRAMELDAIVREFEVGKNYIKPDDSSVYFEIVSVGNSKVKIRGRFSMIINQSGRIELRNKKQLDLADLAMYIRNNGWKVATPEAIAELQK